jgi:hypothetical protein
VTQPAGPAPSGFQIARPPGGELAGMAPWQGFLPCFPQLAVAQGLPGAPAGLLPAVLLLPGATLSHDGLLQDAAQSPVSAAARCAKSNHEPPNKRPHVLRSACAL